MTLEEAIQTMKELKYLAEEALEGNKKDDKLPIDLIMVDQHDVNALGYALAWLDAISTMRAMLGPEEDDAK